MKILITGVSSGIGLSLAGLFQKEEVWGLSRRGPPENLSIRFSPCDVTDWHQLLEIGNQISAAWGGLDALVHCAGTQGAIGPAVEVDPLAWVSTVRENVAGSYFVIRAFLPLLTRRSQRRAKVLLFSGGGASSARPNFSAYACAKTGLVRLVETLAIEWQNLPIDINILAPGSINTAMTQEVLNLGPKIVGELEYKRALSQLENGGDPLEKVIAMIQFLISDESDGVSGRFISAQWDDQKKLLSATLESDNRDAFKLRRIVP
jgi:NAD(P)-dependent dehydrogenase (short-subunit alcohol dehydrogenase family)